MTDGSAFVGSAHRAAVSQLLDHYRAVSVGGARVVCLVGPPGYGKTRIVQEFYARLAADQPEPAYWPGSLRELEGSEMRAILEGRKRVYPVEVYVPEGATMPWFWWAILCHQRPDGSYSQAMFDDATQLLAHADSLLNRVAKANATGRSFDATNAVVGLIGALGVALSPPVGIAIGVAGAARTGWQNRDLIHRIATFRERRSQRRLDAASHGRNDHLVEMASQLVAVSTSVPVVLILDDAHFADSTLVDTLKILFRTDDARVLVVATLWHQELDDPDTESPFPQWWQHDRVDHEVQSSYRIDVAPLAQSDAEALLADDLNVVRSQPRDPALTAQLIQRWGTNPLVLRTLVRLPRVQAALNDGMLEVQAIDQLPHQMETILAEYWDHLPARVQHVLGLASCLGSEFLPAIVSRGGALSGHNDSGRAITEAVRPYAWVRAHLPSLYGFIEPGLLEIAERGAHDVLGRNDRTCLTQALVEFLTTTDTHALPERTAVTLWTQHVRLASAGQIARDATVGNSYVSLALHNARRWQFARAAEFGLAALSCLNAELDDEIALRRQIGGWFRQAGMFQESLRELVRSRDLLAASPTSSSAALVHRDLGDTNRYLGRLDDAVSDFRRALTIFDAAGDLAGAASALNGLADASRGLCRWKDSEASFKRCLELYERLDDTVELARSRVRYGMLARDKGMNHEALPLFQAAMEIFEQCGDRLWTARALRNIAVVERNEGWLESALRHFDMTLAIYSEIADKRGVAVTLRNRGDALRLANRVDAAEEDLLKALDGFQALGDDRWAARARVSLADIYRCSARWEAAQAALAYSLQVSAEIGDRHGLGRTLRAKGLLLRDMGDYSGAEAVFAESRAVFCALGDEVWEARAMAGLASLPVSMISASERDSLRSCALAMIQRITGSGDRATRLLLEW